MGEHKGQVVGYLRVSAADQNEARQFEIIGVVDRLFSQKVSGKSIDDRAQLERKTIGERQAEGIAIAKRKGVHDRAPQLSPEQVEDARQRVGAGVPKASVARDFGVSRQTLDAALSRTGT